MNTTDPTQPAREAARGPATTGGGDFRRKIVSLDRLRAILAGVRREARPDADPPKIVQCHGCFDIVHPGHIRYLQFARAQGDLLLVSITGDAAIDKDTQRPYIPQELRAENLAALELVDYVVIDPHPTAESLLAEIRPNIYVKGHEYATSEDPRFLAERDTVESYGGRVMYSSGQVVFSSSRLQTELIHHQKRRSHGRSAWDDLADQRLRELCRRHAISAESLNRLLSSIRGQRVLIIGDLTIERYVLCDAGDVAGEAPMLALVQVDQRDYVGGAGAVALQAAALGADTTLFTARTKCELGAWAVAELEKAGVRIETLQDRKTPPLHTRFLVDDNKLFRVERSAACPHDSLGERRAVGRLCDAGRGAQTAMLIDHGYGVLTPGLLRGLGGPFRERIAFIGARLTSSAAHMADLPSPDLLCASERRLRKSVRDLESGLSSLAYRTLQETRTRQMIVTLAKRGLVTFERPSRDPKSMRWRGRLLSEHLPAFADAVRDRLGAGDTLMTAATLALSAGGSLMQAAYLASLAASLAVRSHGLTPACPADLRATIHQRDELRDSPACRATTGNEAADLLQERRLPSTTIRPKRTGPPRRSKPAGRGAP